ncbi:Uncharacterised protein [Mycoplasmopsis maculosa]|uniref:Uncharacterized protein n=1 Tax=Mycoplasmopsis maculosa TaxID=114885 RepID=A0A449B4Y3_9BACT|nr:Uncharacterised protein [Mycoplasmopsis maculosa]
MKKIKKENKIKTFGLWINNKNSNKEDIKILFLIKKLRLFFYSYCSNGIPSSST